MTWTSGLKLQILQEFANPWWTPMIYVPHQLPVGIFNAAENADNRITSHKSDDDFRDKVLDLMDTRFVWTSRQLAAAAGSDTPGMATICGGLLAEAGWRLMRGRPGSCSYLNVTRALLWLQEHRTVSLTDAARELGATRQALGAVLREAGWVERRVSGKRIRCRNVA